MTSFVGKTFRGTILGFVKALKGFEDGSDIEIRIR